MHEVEILHSKPEQDGGNGSTSCIELTSMQQAMLFDEVVFNAPAVNCLQIPIRLDRGVNRRRIVAALAAELASQPAARIGFRPGPDDAFVSAQQILSSGPVGPNEFLAERRALFGFCDPRLIRIVAGQGDEPIWLICHHLVADRPGVEAWLKRAAARLNGAAPAPPGCYQDTVAQLRQRSRPPAALAVTADPDQPVRRDAMAAHPVGHAAPAQRVHRLDRHVPAPVWTALADLAAQWRLSQQQLVGALAHYGLDRCRDHRSSRLGVPVSLRDALPDPDLMGCFIGVIGIESRPLAGPDCQTYGQAWRDALLDRYDDRWAAAFGQTRDRSSNHPFDLLFAWHDTCDVDLGDGTARLGMAEAYPGRTPLTLSAQPQRGGLDLALDFDPAVIAAPAARGLLDALVTALDRLAKSADQPPELEALFAAVAAGPAAAADPVCSPAAEPHCSDLFAALDQHAHQRGAAPAIMGGDGQIATYAELAEGIAKAAGWASSVPAGPIGLIMRREPAIVMTLLGLIKAGRTIALIDPDSATAQHDLAMLGGSQFCGLGCDAGEWSDCTAIDALESGSDPAAQLDRSAQAGVIIFTSGSTGAARPVLLGFPSIARHAGWAAQAFDLGPADRVLQFCAMAFDAMLEEILPGLLVGAAVILRDETAAQGGSGLLRFCADMAITVADLPTGFFNLAAADLAEVPWPPALRLVVIGGEAYHEQAVVAWHGAMRAHGCRLCTSYGPTEASIVVTLEQLQPGDPPALLGTARPGADLLVLDSTGRPAMPGCTGELWLGGSVLALGYAGRPAETAERFRPNPFGPPGSLLYRTGDLVRTDDDGRLLFVGRSDRQVKLQGRRFEAERTEDLLAQMAGVPAILHVPDYPGAMPLAWVSCSADSAAARSVLDAVAKMPAWHRPAHVRFGPLPLTGRGKIDRPGAMRLLEADQPAIHRDPDGAFSAELAIIVQALGGRPAGLEEDFLALGGNSLGLLYLASLSRSTLGRAPAIGALYQNTAIAALCQTIRDAPSAAALMPADLHSNLPVPALSPASAAWLASAYETALYLDIMRRSNAAAYRIRTSWTVPSRLDPQRFARAAQAVIARHPLLSAQITERAGMLSWHPVAGDEPPPAHLALVPADHGESTTIVFETSHLACDEAGIDRVLTDLARAYTAIDFDLGPPQVPPRPVHRADLLSVWKGRDTDRFSSRLPRSVPDGIESSRAVETAQYPAGSITAGFPGHGGFTPFVVTLVPALVWLARLSAEGGAQVWTPFRLGDQDGVRLNITSLPVSLATPGAASLADMCAGVQRELAWVFDHRHLDPASVASAIGQAAQGLGPLFDLVDDRNAASLLFDGIAAQQDPGKVTTVRADLEISARINVAGDLTYGLRSRDGLHPLPLLEIWARGLADLALALFEQPFTPQANFALHRPLAKRPVQALPASNLLATKPVLPQRLRTALAGQAGDCIIAEDQRLDGQAALAVADALTARMLGLGIKPGHAVAIALPRCAAYPAAMLAVWQAGAIPVLVNPGLPPALQDQMQLVSGAICRIGATGPAAQTVGTPTVDRIGNEPPRLDPLRAAYGAFTSGTTGRPKLVLVGWRGLERLLEWSHRTLPMGVADGFLHVATPGFDIGLFEILHPLLNGARLLIAPRVDDPVGLAKFAAREGASHLHFVPALLGAFLDAADESDLAQVKLVMSGGDAVPVELARRVLGSGMAFQHCYGPTETTIFVASTGIEEHDCTRPFLSLGAAIDGSTLTVRDRFGQILPPGIPGELVVTGDSLALGYYHDSRNTAASFGPVADEAPDGAGLAYRTGDRAMVHLDGSLQHLGRIDRQLKISGVRIEPVAIETALEEIGGVRKAAVFVMARGGVTILAAAVQADLPDAAEAQRFKELLRASLAQRLGAAAVPRMILLVQQLPVTSNGKVNLSALQDLALENADAEFADSPNIPVQQMSEQMRHLLAVWTQILGQTVHPQTDFFKAGGDSMAAIRMVAQAAQHNLSFSIADVFRNPTPAQLLELMDRRQTKASVYLPAVPGMPAPLAPAARDWLSRTARFSSDDVLAIQYPLRGGTTAAQLADALSAVIERHDGLRIAVQSQERQWLCQFAEAYRPDCGVFDTTDDALHAAIKAVDPARGRLLGTAMIAVSPPQCVLAVHHLGIDPASWPSLVDAVETALSGGDLALSPVRPFSASCQARNPELARIARPEDNPGRRRQISRTAALASVTERRLSSALVAALGPELTGQRLAIAAEQPGRCEADEAAIGWFTTFLPIQPGVQDEGVAPDVAVNLVPGESMAQTWQVLRADIPPVHSLAVELCQLPDAAATWTLSLSADDSWDETRLQGLADEVMARLEGAGDEAQLPITPLQTAMILASCAGPSRTAYHTQIVFEPTGSFDPDRLIAAWADAHRRHDALRLRFALQGDDLQPVLTLGEAQAEPPNEAATMPTIRRHHPDQPVTDLLDDFLAEDLARPFGAGQPLSRIALIEGADGQRLIWSHHHAILDGWSLNLVTQSVAAAYHRRQLALAPLPPAPSIRPFAQWWQQQPLAQLASQVDELVGAWPRGPGLDGRAVTRGRQTSTCGQLDEHVTADLIRLARHSGATLFELCLAALAIVDAQRRGDGAGLFRFIATVRPDQLPGIDHTAGLCMNVLPLRLAVSRSLTELLAEVRTCMAQVMEIAAASPYDVARALREAGLGGRIDTTLVFENYPGDRQGVPLGTDGFLRVLSAREEGEARFTLVIMPDDALTFELIHADDPQTSGEAKVILSGLIRVLTHFATLNRSDPTENTDGA